MLAINQIWGLSCNAENAFMGEGGGEEYEGAFSQSLIW